MTSEIYDMQTSTTDIFKWSIQVPYTKGMGFRLFVSDSVVYFIRAFSDQGMGVYHNQQIYLSSIQAIKIDNM